MPEQPEPAWIGSSQHYRWLEWVVRGVVLLNLADALLTLVSVLSHHARESNPLMEGLIAQSPPLFVAAKLALISLGTLLLWRNRHLPLAVGAIFFVFVVYYGLFLLHLAGISFWI